MPEALVQGLPPKLTWARLADRKSTEGPRGNAVVLIETDGPYMCPEPCRGQTAHPGHVHRVAERVAEWQCVDLGVMEDKAQAPACPILEKLPLFKGFRQNWPASRGDGEREG